MSGVIQGGWEFVVAGYALTASVMLIYTISLFVRYRSEKRRNGG